MKKSKIISIIIIIILITNVIFQVRSLADDENNTANNNTAESSNTTNENVGQNETVSNNEVNSLNTTNNTIDTNSVGETNITNTNINTNTDTNTNTNSNTDTNTVDNTTNVATSLVISYFLKDGDIEWSLNNDETIKGYVGDKYNIETDSEIYLSLIKSGNYVLSGDNVNSSGILTESAIYINVYLEIAGSSGVTSLSNGNSSAFGKNSENMMEMSNEENEEFTNMKSMLAQTQSDLDTANGTISSLTESTTYQGSQNNYLETLSISGVEFKNEFKKTTNTYFASVDSDTTSVTVKATAEDSSATVTIYGNTSLQSGTNKILINVTADDGSIRTYRIYVTKQ